MDIILDVVDSMSNTALPGATVFVNGTAVGQTDNNGVYQLSANSSDQIKISYIGYSDYIIAAGIIEGSAQIQMARATDNLPTVTVTPSPSAPNYLAWIIGGVVAVTLLSDNKKSVGAKKDKTALYIGAGLGLGAIYFMTKSNVAAPATQQLLTTQQMVANKAASSSNPLSALSSLLPSLSSIFGGSSVPAPGTPGSFTPVAVDTGNYQTPVVTAPDVIPSDSSLNLDFSPAPVSGIGARYTGKKFAGIGARYSAVKVRQPMSNLGGKIHPLKLGSVTTMIPWIGAACLGAIALGSKKKRIGDTDYSKYIIPIGVVGAGIYILSQTGLFGNSANAQNNSQIASGSLSSINAAIATETASGGFATLTAANCQSLANDIYNNIQSGSPDQDQVVRDIIQSNTLLDWLYIKQAFGTKSFNTGSWLSLCAIAQINCTTVDLDSALKAILDATHIATINNYFSSQGINYSL